MDAKAFYYGHSVSEMHKDMQDVLDTLSITKSFSKGEIIYRQGDTATTFCYLKSGRVKVFMTSVDGMEKTLNTASHGEILGEGAFFDKKPRVSSARAVTDVEVVMIDEKRLTELFTEHPRLAFELLEILANRIRLLSSQLDSMTFMQADARIAQMLLKSEKNGKVSITHEEIATEVGVSRVTVSKTLSKFSKSGYISTGYRSVIIKNREKLEEIADN